MNSSISNSKITKYLFGFVFFIVILFLFDRGLYYLIYTVENDYFYSKSNYERNFSQYMKGKSFTAALFGTSRSYEGILPDYLGFDLKQKVFKEAFQGKGPKYNYYFYKLFKKYAGVPKMVIYGADYFIYTVKSDPLYMSRFDVKERPRIDFFSSPLMLLKNKKQIDNFQNNILIKFQEKKSRKEIKEAMKVFIDIQEYKGMEPVNKKLITKEPHEYMRQDFPRFPGEEGDYFVKLLDELDRDNVMVLLITLPDYYGSYKTNVQLNDFIDNLNAYKKKYKKLVVINYNRPDRFPLNNPDYFRDGGYGMTNSHLSGEGARAFSQILGKDIMTYYPN